ncbi:MAG: ATP-binding protein [Acidobacteriota bacterium]|nr:ATP-binding protein [Acidobacteriota bacterium]
MKTDYLTFTVERRESLEPNDQKAGEIYSRLGYGIADAIADLVDNSVDAGASHVLIRFERSSGGIHRVLIVDDGHGMKAEALREAMRFGSDVKSSDKHLGKYGIGLKSASLSQAEVVTVLSKVGRSHVGRRWTLQNIKKHWSCEILDSAGVEPAFGVAYGDVKVKRSGTLVIWEKLEHLRALPANIDKVLGQS